jgi:hypothetical protein
MGFCGVEHDGPALEDAPADSSVSGASVPLILTAEVTLPSTISAETLKALLTVLRAS